MKNNIYEETPLAETSAFKPLDYLKITIFGFALSAMANGLHTIILPLRVLDFVPETQKSTYLSLLTFTGLVIAMIIQPVAGAISDRSKFRWGRRRPYIFIGAIAVVCLLFGVGSATSYIALFIVWCCIQAFSNVAQGPYQAFIPDLVPEDRKGIASGVKVVLEIIGGVIILKFIGYFMGTHIPGIADSGMWTALGILGCVLLVAMAITVFTVHEKPGSSLPAAEGLPQTPSGSISAAIRKNRAFIYFLVSRLLFYMAITTIQSFALFYLQDVVKLPNAAAATADLLIVVGVCMIAIAYPAGLLSDKIGRKPVIIGSGLLGALGTLLLLWSSGYTYVMICGGIIGIATGAFMSTNWALATDLVPRSEEAKYLGFTNIATAGGGALARLIGPVIDYFNASQVNLGYTVMLSACFVYFLVGSLLIFPLKKATR